MLPLIKGMVCGRAIGNAIGLERWTLPGVTAQDTLLEMGKA